VKTFSRLQLNQIDPTPKIKETTSIEGNVSCGSIVEILKYYTKRDFNKVKLDLRNDNDFFKDVIK
jgi:hypothetical protein